MITFLKAVFAVFCISIVIGMIVCVLWFIGAMVVNFWKIYIKKKPIKNCQHPNTVYTENHPDKVWTCCDCGESV